LVQIMKPCSLFLWFFFLHSIELKSEMLQALDSGHCHWIFQSLFFL
jgi:hypothetical protein